MGDEHSKERLFYRGMMNLFFRVMPVVGGIVVAGVLGLSLSFSVVFMLSVGILAASTPVPSEGHSWDDWHGRASKAIQQTWLGRILGWLLTVFLLLAIGVFLLNEKTWSRYLFETSGLFLCAKFWLETIYNLRHQRVDTGVA